MTHRLLRATLALLPVIAACGGSGGDLPTNIAPSNSACAGLVLPAPMAVGEVRTVTTSDRLCIRGGATAAEYTLVAFNSDSATAVPLTVVGDSLGAPPTSSLVAPSGATASRGAFEGRTALVPDIAFHARLRRAGEALASRIPDARRWRASRTTIATAADGLTPGGGISRATIGANPQVGQIVNLNVDGAGDCTTIDTRAARIVAVGTKSVVLADTANPTGGFTTADYQRFAANFDTLVYPVDVNAFGAPADIDGNGRVGILFTRAVNELTPANNPSYVGGFFTDRDLFPRAGTPSFQACAGSNEAELFYMLAPDPTGVVNGNVRTTALVDDLTTSTIAHEFQHLINASRRMYVSTTATTFEVVWLNEGLSHIAEELLYYRQTGKAPRQNLDDAAIRTSSAANYAIWKADLGQNFSRLVKYLQDPPARSPVVEDDDLSTRGATWSFLRYAADRTAPTDGDIWFKLVNSPTKGFGTLRLALGNDPKGLLRDWTVANYTDDIGLTTDPKYMHASWNYRDIYTKTFLAGVYPLKVTQLANGASNSVSIRQNSASYYRLSATANRDAQLRSSSAGAATSGALQLMLVRTR